MIDHILSQYCDAVLDTDRDLAMKVVHDALHAGISAEDLVFKIVIPSIEQMLAGVSEKQDISLAQHFLASQISAEVVEEMITRFQVQPKGTGRIVIGTSHGDYHGLGKRIVIGCLKAHLYEVVDLGLSVPAERFVEEAVAHDAPIIGISSMMAHTALGENGCRGVRRILRERGLESSFRIIVGGAPYRFDENLYRLVEADAWAKDGFASVEIVGGLLRDITGSQQLIVHGISTHASDSDTPAARRPSARRRRVG